MNSLRSIGQKLSRRALFLLANASGALTSAASTLQAEPAARVHEGPAVFATRAAASAARMGPEQGLLQLLGYSRPDDRGGQCYVRDTKESPGAFKSADGAWWKPTALPLRPEQFGARGDGSSDDSLAINTMIQLAAALQTLKPNSQAAAMILSGSYRIEAPIQLWNEVDGEIVYGSFVLEGEAPSYVAGRAPEIVAAFYDRPIIAMQAMRMSVLRNFQCRREVAVTLPSPSDLMQDTGGVRGQPWWNPKGMLSDEQFSMAAGINVDPFSDGLPLDGGYKGWTRYYSKAAGADKKSSVISFEGVAIRHNIVAVAVGCAKDSNLVDSITFDSCLLGLNKVAIATGTDQARACCVRDCHIVGVRTIFDGSSYGQRIGVMPTVFGGILDICKWLLNFEGGAGRGDGVMVGTYSESLWSLGYWAGPYPLTLTACKLKFLLAEAYGCARVAQFIGQNLVLLGGSWSFYRGEPHKCFIANIGNIRVDGTQFDDQPIFADPLSLDVARMPLRYLKGGPSYGVAMTHTLLAGNSGTAGEGCCIMAVGGTVLFTGPRGSQAFRNFEGPIVTRIDTAMIERTGRGKGIYKAADPGAYQIGDYLCQDGQRHKLAVPGGGEFSFFGNWPQYLGRVSAIDGSTITLSDLLEGFPGGPTQIYLGPRFGAFHARSIGATTAGSNRINDVFNISTWAVGQRLRIFDENARCREFGPAGAYIIEIDKDARVIVLSRSVSTTIPTALLCDALTDMMGKLPRELGAPTYGAHWSGDSFSIFGIAKSEGDDRTVMGYVCTKSGGPGQWKPNYLN